MKKLIAACLALAMALTLAVPALAAETPDVGIIGGADGPTMVSVATITQQAPTQEQMNAYLAAKGGTPGQINVMVDGKCVPFTGVFPSLISGRTMVPLRGVLEFLGAQVDYDRATRTATVTGEDVSFTHVIGTDRITLGGSGEELTMDVASLVQSGSTLVPLRFFSQTLGFDVFWDKDYRTAVVIDRESFVADFDKSFTILNDYMAQQYKDFDLTKPVSEDVTLTADVKVIDSINGDKTYKVSGDFDMVMAPEALGISGRLELGDLLTLLGTAAAPLTGGEGFPEAMVQALSPLTFDMIASGDQLYLKSPLVSYIIETSGHTVPGGEVWLAAEAEGLTEMLTQYTQMLGRMKTMTFGQVLYEILTMAGGENSALLYDTMGEMAQIYRLMMGDSTWTKSGSTYKWHMGEGEFEALMETMTGEKTSLAQAGITKYAIDMTLGQGGKVDMSAEVAGQGVQFSIKGTGSAGRSSLTGILQVQNVCDVRFKLDAGVKTGGAVPAVPSGASVIRSADL